MVIESLVLLPVDHAMDNNDSETSEIVNCDSAVVEEEGNSANKEASLEVPLGNKQDAESLGTIGDIEHNSGDAAKAIPPNGVALELLISCKAPDESLPMDCQTPRESIFDPFAPGQEDAVCGAPKKKMNTVSEVISRRQLNFEGGDIPVKRLSFDSDDSEEDLYIQGIHKMLIDLIISNQLKEAGREDHPLDDTPAESFKTPVSKPSLTGIADTCPNAPSRPSLKLLKLTAQAFAGSLTLVLSVQSLYLSKDNKEMSLLLSV